MRCIACESDTRVIDSRKTKDGSIHRRRECKTCGYRFSTLEVEALTLDVLLAAQKFVGDLADITREIQELQDATR